MFQRLEPSQSLLCSQYGFLTTTKWIIRRCEGPERPVKSSVSPVVKIKAGQGQRSNDRKRNRRITAWLRRARLEGCHKGCHARQAQTPSVWGSFAKCGSLGIRLAEFLLIESSIYKIPVVLRARGFSRRASLPLCPPLVYRLKVGNKEQGKNTMKCRKRILVIEEEAPRPRQRATPTPRWTQTPFSRYLRMRHSRKRTLRSHFLGLGKARAPQENRRRAPI